jgi:hypothetical protein
MRGWQSARSKEKARDAAWRDATARAPSWPPAAQPVAPAPAVPAPVEAIAAAAVETPVVRQLDMQPEVLRLLEVVTGMCDHVIEYIEADRAERRLMIETLAQLGRVITDGAAVAVAARASAPPVERPAESPLEAPFERELEAPEDGPPEQLDVRERVIGGSMPAGPEPVIDLRDPEPDAQPQFGDATATTREIAVEVRGRFGDRWVGGFEICEVMTTPDGPRYRLRRHRDGVVLPELFDATCIRHIETFDQLNGDQLNDSTGYWSRS